MVCPYQRCPIYKQLYACIVDIKLTSSKGVLKLLHIVTVVETHDGTSSLLQHRGRILQCGGQQQYQGPCTNRDAFFICDIEVFIIVSIF